MSEPLSRDRGPEDPPALDGETALGLLRTGELEIEGRLLDASNATLYCAVGIRGSGDTNGLVAHCVYKPVRGERPLWDFPEGTLAAREVAAYVVSAATGWAVVPPTVMRDGPFGPGMCQLWIDVDERVDLTRLARSDHPALRRMALFDAVVNNGDRKGGHLLPTPDGHVYGVDHGVCFHVDDKLRTVLWGWRGQPLSAEEVEVLGRLRADLEGGPLERALREHLSRREAAAVSRRIDRLLRTDTFPSPSTDWPALPWPPF